MENYQQRVIDEKKELDGRIYKLSAFIDGDVFNELSAEEQRLLNSQLKVIQEYSMILNDRIAIF